MRSTRCQYNPLFSSNTKFSELILSFMIEIAIIVQWIQGRQLYARHEDLSWKNIIRRTERPHGLGEQELHRSRINMFPDMMSPFKVLVYKECQTKNNRYATGAKVNVLFRFCRAVIDMAIVVLLIRRIIVLIVPIMTLSSLAARWNAIGFLYRWIE